MRVYFIGAHATGKTTLARYVSETWKLPFLNEIARTILAEKELNLQSLRTNLHTVNDYQTEIFLRQFEEENKHTEFVSDRSFDNLAYMAQHSTVLTNHINNPNLTNYVNKLKTSKDVIMFFVRPSRATMQNDGVRESVVWDNIIAVDAMVKFMLEMWGLDYIAINTDSMQERARLIDSVIKLSISL